MQGDQPDLRDASLKERTDPEHLDEHALPEISPRRSGLDGDRRLTVNSTIALLESNGANPSVGALKRILDGIPAGLAEVFAFGPERPRKAFYAAEELVEIGKGPVSYRQSARRWWVAPCRS